LVDSDLAGVGGDGVGDELGVEVEDDDEDEDDDESLGLSASARFLYASLR